MLTIAEHQLNRRRTDGLFFPELPDICMLWAGIQLLHAGLQLLITSFDLGVEHAAMSFSRPEQQRICCNKCLMQ